MQTKTTLSLLAVCFLLAAAGNVQAQIPDEYNGVVYRGAFNSVARGVMDGNLIETNYRNHGELARWGDIPWGVWPRNIGGRHIDGVGVVVAGYVDGADGSRFSSYADYVEWKKTYVVPDTTLNPVMINYRDAGVRTSPYSGDVWGWLPLPGFNNPLRRAPFTDALTPIPAKSNDPASWPSFWPDRLDEEDSGWPDTWNGRDGRFANADQESFYVMDDFSDMEYGFDLETDGPHSALGVYYPSPETDSLMGGFGLQTQVRIYQWANILAEDTMFLIYRITNKGDEDHDRLYFVQIVDYGLGQDEDDDNASYDPILDVVYGWDSDGLGTPTNGGAQYELGYTGFAFLESPANDRNNQDDDQDGITDESRFDENYMRLDSELAIQNFVQNNYNVADFESYYSPVVERPAFKKGIWYTTDENMDWRGFDDANNNGVVDAGEVLNNDVGRDGLGLFDLNYPGPDEGEGDGIPTQGEPNYNDLDVDESDQIGLRGFDLNTRPFYESGNNLRDDTWLFNRIRISEFPLGTIPPSDPVANDEPFLLFMSGQVELNPEDQLGGKSTDFFSTAWIFGNDEQDFLKNRRTVQNIYNADYKFAQPPIVPTLTAVTGDRQVVLSWDTLSVRSYDNFLQDFDFEGYKLYKGTNNLFTDARTITDVNGTPTFYKPIARWDLDNDISGMTTILEGEAVYDLGSNTGLAFHYVDNEVTNGKTYYYAIVAYDRGLPAEEGSDAPGIDPQENTFRVSVDLQGNLTGTSINTAAVVPVTTPAGYVDGGATIDLSSVTGGTGTGSASVSVVVESELEDSFLYRIEFADSNSVAADYRVTTGYRIKELTQNRSVVGMSSFSTSTSVINGFTINMTNPEPGEIIENKSGWVSNEGTENELFNYDPTELDGINTDWEVDIDEQRDGSSNGFRATDSDYELLFVDPADSLYSPPRVLGGGFSRFDIPIFARNSTSGTSADILIIDNDDSDDISDGDQLIISEEDSLGRDIFRFVVSFDAGPDNIAPSPGDKVVISTTRSFGRDDYFEFGVRKGYIDNELASNELENIYVAPNPYVGAASWEKISNSIGRGERKISFFNLPRKCTIRIFNIRGELIKTINHDGDFNVGSADWDLRTNNNEDVAYGVYFYHVSAEGLGEYVDKFAIVK